MKKRIVKLTETDLRRIVKRVIKENRFLKDDSNFIKLHTNIMRVARKYQRMTNNDFFLDFIREYKNEDEFKERLMFDYTQSEEDMYDFESGDDFYDMWDPETEIHMLETEFSNFPGVDLWPEFYNELVDAGW
jgi:hypothetical protein